MFVDEANFRWDVKFTNRLEVSIDINYTLFDLGVYFTIFIICKTNFRDSCF